MKLVITESQLKKIISEQLTNSNYQTGAGSYYGTYGYNKEGKTVWTDLDPHTKNTILAIGTSFIPLIGPFLSAGIGLLDAKLYYEQGDKKTAGIVGLLSLIPGIGGLGAKLGLGKWSAKMLAELGKKIAKGAKLSQLELKVAQRISQNGKLIQSEINNFSKSKGLNPKNNFNYGQKNAKNMVVPTKTDSLIPKELASILQNLKPIKVDSRILNTLKSQRNEVVRLDGNLKRLASSGEGLTRAEYNSADLAADRIMKTIGNIKEGDVVDIKSLIENGYKILDDLERSFKKIPKDRELIEPISMATHRFLNSIKSLTGYKGFVRTYS